MGKPYNYFTEQRPLKEALRMLWAKEYPNQPAALIESYQWERVRVPLLSIRCIGKPKSIKKARLYLDKLRQGIVVFPPLVCWNGEVIDGFHRYWAYEKAGFITVDIVRNVDVQMVEAA